MLREVAATGLAPALVCQARFVMLRGHELIEHTADVGLRVWAPTLSELFAEGGIALISVMGSASGPADRREEIVLEAPDLVALLVDWLSEVLFLFEARSVAPVAAYVTVTESPYRVSGVLEGVDASDLVQTGPAVKAVTYHEAVVRQTGSGYEARVYLDV